MTTDKDHKARSAELFKEVLSKDLPDEPVDTQRATVDLEIDTNPPSNQQVISAIKGLKNGKAPGLDNLNVELFKADLNFAAEILLPLFTEIWEQEKIPFDCTKVVIIEIPKKGALSDCSKLNGEG